MKTKGYFKCLTCLSDFPPGKMYTLEQCKKCVAEERQAEQEERQQEKALRGLQ